MSIYDNNKELLSVLGVEGNYSTDFEVRKAILNALGGDASMCNSIYEVDLQILKIYQEGGGSGSFVVPDGMKFTNSTLTEFPEGLDFSEVTNFNIMFQYCRNLTIISHLDTSSGVDFGGMFEFCTSLTEIPQIDVSKGTIFGWMFSGCSSLTEIPQLDVSKGDYFDRMFVDCRNLITISALNISSGTNLFGIVLRCNKLENITFVGSINYDISFDSCIKLTYESVKSILTACSNTTNTNSKTVTFNRTLTDQNGELANLIATCTSKGWTVSGLTLE